MLSLIYKVREPEDEQLRNSSAHSYSMQKTLIPYTIENIPQPALHNMGAHLESSTEGDTIAKVVTLNL